MVMAQALFKALRNDAPHKPIDVLAPAWSLPVVERMPEVRAGIASETGHGEVGIGKRRRIGQGLRGQYDHAIVLPRSLKSALIPWFAKVPLRTGYKGESRYLFINDMRPFDKSVLNQTVKRYVALGAELPIRPDIFPTLRVDAKNQQRVAAELGLVTDAPVIGLMPGAEYGPAKCWPLESFTVLARQLQEAGFAVWVMGSEKDGAAGKVIAEGSGATNLCGKTSLADVIDALALCQQVVSNDSGLMHVAAAVGSHVHGIYGSSSPDFTPPLTESCTIHHLDLDCSPCFKRECPLEHLHCLTQISAEGVFDAIEDVAG